MTVYKAPEAAETKPIELTSPQSQTPPDGPFAKIVELRPPSSVTHPPADELAEQNQRQAEELEALRQLNCQLKEANTELEAFSYTVAHDLRAPLRALAGYIGILLEDYASQLDPQGRDHLQALDRAARRMDCLTHDLLAYTRVARECVKLQALPLRPVIDDAIALTGARQIDGAKITINPGLPHVMGNRFLLLQCLSNLVSNAAKYVAPGRAPEIHLYARTHGAHVRIFVRDHGIGIDPGHHHKLFGMFQRVADMQLYEGTGIGLAIVSRAAHRMGGTCGLESRPGKGSCFWVDLLAVSPALKNTSPA